MRTTPRLSFAVVAVCATLVPLRAQEGLSEAARADSIRKYRFLGKTARDKKDLEAALGYYRNLVIYQPDYQRGHYYIGQILAQKGDYAGAKAAYLTSSALDSLHRNTHLGLYQIYMTEAVADSAWWALSRVIAAYGEGERPAFGYATTPRPYREYRRKLGDLFRRQGKTEEAIAHYTSLIGPPAQARPEDRELIELIVDLDREIGEVDEALAWQKGLLSLGGSGGGDVSDRVEALSSMVDLMVEGGDVAAAIANLRKLAKLDERGRYSHYHRMHQLAEESGDRAARIEALQGMVSANPRDLESLASLIEVYLGAEDAERAAKWIDWGLQATPGDPQLHLLEGDLRVLQGNEEGALASFELARADPGWEAVAQQRIWQIRPPETEEERLKRQFFGSGDDADDE